PTGIQEIIILMIVIGILGSTGWWPRIMQGLRELRGDPSSGGVSAHDLDMSYKILGLSPSCSWADIERAYHNKAQIHHPAKGGDEDGMRVLNDVYSKLKKVHRNR